MAKVGPIIMLVAGDEFNESARILAVIWEGSTTAGDTVRLAHRDEWGTLLWPGRANDTNTYLGANFGDKGLHAPQGFRLQQISSGQVLVYLRED